MPAPRKRTSAKTAPPATDLPIGMAMASHAERAANCELDLIRLFLSQQKQDIARRRLQKLHDEFPSTAAAKEARRLLKSL